MNSERDLCSRQRNSGEKECSPERGRCQGGRAIIMGLPNARGTTSVTCHLSQRFITCNSEDSCYDRNTMLLQAGVRLQLQAHYTVMFSLSSPIFLSLHSHWGTSQAREIRGQDPREAAVEPGSRASRQGGSWEVGHWPGFTPAGQGWGWLLLVLPGDSPEVMEGHGR